jgi:hypothetical protein
MKTATIGVGRMMRKVISAISRRVRRLPAYVAHANQFLSGRYAAFPPSPSIAASSVKKNASKTKIDKPTFEEWQVLNPGGTFKEYYVGSIVDALSGKKSHATLGPVTQKGSLERAEKVARTLIGLGVSKSDLVVDYGCGTLRVGKTLIEYLEPSRYVGLDIDRRILDTGLAMLPRWLAEQRTPILDVIDDEVLSRIASMRPRWIFSKGVIHHVPPSDLAEFFGNISRLSYPETEVLLWARFSDTTRQASKRTWFHGIESVISLARSFKLDGEIGELDSARVIRFRRS